MASQEKIWDSEYIKNPCKWNKETPYLPNLIKNKSVLEIGVGNGKTLRSILRQKPKSITVIDISKEAIKISKSLFKEKKVNFLKANIKNIPFKEEEFNIIVCYYIFNNLKERERKKAVSEIYRVLKRGGKILFEDFEEGDFRKKEGKEIENNTIKKRNNIIQHFFTKKEILLLFTKFSKVKIKEFSFYPFKGKKNIKRKIISAIFKK